VLNTTCASALKAWDCAWFPWRWHENPLANQSLRVCFLREAMDFGLC